MKRWGRVERYDLEAEDLGLTLMSWEPNKRDLPSLSLHVIIFKMEPVITSLLHKDMVRIKQKNENPISQNSC